MRNQFLPHEHTGSIRSQISGNVKQTKPSDNFKIEAFFEFGELFIVIKLLVCLVKGWGCTLVAFYRVLSEFRTEQF